MTNYNYHDSMIQDINEWFEENPEMLGAGFDPCYDQLWITDSVTGNASGSYTFNAWQAGEYVESNMGLAIAAFRELSTLEDFCKRLEGEEWEYIDVTIRCYLLSDVLREAFEIRGFEV